MKNKVDNKADCKKSSVGGQAIMEGVMMQSPSGVAVSVRKDSGEIVSDYEDYVPLSKRNKFYALPIIRGCVSFCGSLSMGMKTMMKGVDMLGIEQEEPSKFEIWLAKTVGADIEKIVMAVAVVIAVALAMLLFIVVPALGGAFVGNFTKSQLLINGTEGITRIVVFVLYLVLISLMKDIKRVFMYHGAEHKTIACYEAGLELNIENAKIQSRFHARCGTNYLFLVMMVSILFFSLVAYTGPVWGKMLLKIALLPVVAGVSYEVLKWGARGDGILARAVRWPGMKLQFLTTREPDDDMLEVAIRSFEIALDPTEFLQKKKQAEDSKIEENEEKADKA